MNNDLISRQQAFDALHCRFADGFEEDRWWNSTHVIAALKGLPAVPPERKTGRWLPDNTDYYRTRFICSVCGESEEVPTTGFGYGTMWDYCPMCGAKMEGERKE